MIVDCAEVDKLQVILTQKVRAADMLTDSHIGVASRENKYEYFSKEWVKKKVVGLLVRGPNSLLP